MRKIIILAFIGLSTLFANVCEDKIQNLKEQIQKAEQNKHTNKVDSLKTALEKLEKKCGEGDEMLDELKDKVAKYEDKTEEAKKDISEAEAKGKALKVKAEETKLKMIESELEKAKKDLLNYLEK
ncbi:MAG: DUF1090 domain-containing protein [Helicobacteraceae bacterium]|nr:DUF1090 domain-containing protein [Helicobacteraceae bacterium]